MNSSGLIWAPRRFRYAVLLLILLSPSMFFAGIFAATYLPSPTKINQYTTTSSDGNLTLVVTLSYPSYLIGGERVPITLGLKMGFTQPYVALYVVQVGIEVRQALVINSTTNVVQSWRVLISNYTTIGRNYTAANTFSTVFNAAVTYPLNDSILQILGTNRKVGINGIANVTTYAVPGSSVSAGNEVFSVLDDQAVYTTQLSDVASPLSWVFYQVVAVAVVSILGIYTRTRTDLPKQADTLYLMRLNAYRLEASIQNLEEWMRSNRISDAKYRELRERYERELEELRKTIQSSSQP